VCTLGVGVVVVLVEGVEEVIEAEPALRQILYGQLNCYKRRPVRRKRSEYAWLTSKRERREN
jgi:hypothetical protein